jgi:drug/metabolite transporter (DMT)-like permease
VGAVALGLALLAAISHASWNLLVARTSDTHLTTAVAIVSGVVVFAPIAALVWQVPPQALPFIAASAALELLYFALLARAYQSTDLSVIYPLARGSAPVMVLIVGGARSPLQLFGVLLVAAGTLLVRGLKASKRSRDLVIGLAIGACIAAYTLVDQRGVQLANPVAYLEAVMVVPAIVYAAFVTKGSPKLVRGAVTPGAIVAGALMFGAYGLTLAALQLAPAAAVSAVRETSVVIAVALARWTLREAVGSARLLGAVSVAAGVAAVALG